MVHKRSQQSIVRRRAIADARRDREMAETICVTTSDKLSDAVKEEWGYVDQHVINLAPGDVLTDSRGRGFVQAKLPPKSEFPFRVICTRKGRSITIPLPGR